MNVPRINFRAVGLLALLGCWIVALVFNLYRGISDKNIPMDIEIDYILENAKRVELDPMTGLPARLFRAKQLEHYPALRETELTDPYLTIYKPDLIWHIRAKKGTAREAPEKQIALKEEVVIQKEEPHAPLAVLMTDFLTYFPPEEKLETESPVTILQGKQRVEALGMRAFLKTKQVDLFSRVRGYYEPAP